MEEKWLHLYRRTTKYDQTLKILKIDFERCWLNIKPSPVGEVEDEYKFLGLLGQGGFGTVVLCKSKITNKPLAIKILIKQHYMGNSQVRHVIFERKILNCVCFPFVIYLKFSLKNRSCLYLGLPYIEGGELFTYHRALKRFTEDEGKFYAAQAFLALEYLHNADIIYRDLKPENLLLDRQGYIKLTDLGFAKKIDTRTYSFCGTPEYFAPELIRSQPYGKSVDWWAFGVLIYEFIAGSSPFISGPTNQMALFDKIVSGKYSTPHFFSLELKELVKNLLQTNISRRYGCMKNSSNDIKFHKWFKNTNWTAILNGEIDAFYLPQLKKVSELKSYTSIEHSKLQNNFNEVAFDEFHDF